MKYVFIFFIFAITVTAGFSFIHDTYIKLRPIKFQLFLLQESIFIDTEAWQEKLQQEYQNPTLEYSIASVYKKIQENPLVEVSLVKWDWNAGFSVYMTPLEPIGQVISTDQTDDGQSLLLFSNLNTMWVNKQDYRNVIDELPKIYTQLFSDSNPLNRSLMANIPSVIKLIRQSKLGIENIYITDWGHWTLQLDDQSEIILGSEQLEQRLDLITQIQPDSLCTSQNYASVDMRYESAFALNCKT